MPTPDFPCDSETLELNYSRARKKCDLVMKGGITSGVVYPWALCELATAYRFKSIGGTSAGAIAAALAAAAEYRRNTGENDGFEELARLPGWIGADNHMLSLFQPAPDTARLFDLLMGLLAAKSRNGIAAAGAILAVLWTRYPTAASTGGLFGGLLVLASLFHPHPLAAIYGAAFGIVTALLLGTLAAIGNAARDLGTRVTDNFFGICSGLDRRNPQSPPPLTEWLADKLDSVAGSDDPAQPLTFGDLANAKTDGASEEASGIQLLFMTTNVTFGRPYRLPFDQNGFYFRRSEFERLFPPRIVEWMMAHPPAKSGAGDSDTLAEREAAEPDGDLFPLPDAEHLPVVVATRMSLSFPLLLSAVPLWAVDWSRRHNWEAKKTGRPVRFERCWFSDGGISSNFPVHFFDSPLPAWPTFGVNLRPFHPDYPRHPDESACQNIWLPRTNQGGKNEWWNHFDEKPGAPALLGFLSGIMGTMQNWMDNTQTSMPGYRDRVVHIKHDETEGGLNLDMPPGAIQALSTRGRCAGKALRTRFGGTVDDDIGPRDPWLNHRWVRFRSTMELLEDAILELGEGLDREPPGEPGFEQLVREKGVKQPSYKLPRKKQALEALNELQALARQWKKRGPVFGEPSKPPRPEPELRIRPRI